MTSVPVFIICRNLVSPLKELVSWLELVGLDQIHIIDNDSKYPPMVEYLKDTPHTVHYLRRNVGHLSPWKNGLVKKVCGSDSRYIVTDGDVVPTECPLDTPKMLDELLSKYEAGILKVGLGLNIYNLPDHNKLKKKVVEWETQFWHSEIEPGVYRAAVDTTFALYKPLRKNKALSSDGKHVLKDALRTGFPYVARHDPWHWDTHNLTEEQRFYIKHSSTATHWTNQLG